ncbi:hypothetical protein AAMO2058_000959400 [Amorphochlora amoebiformis]
MRIGLFFARAELKLFDEQQGNLMQLEPPREHFGPLFCRNPSQEVFGPASYEDPLLAFSRSPSDVNTPSLGNRHTRFCTSFT